MTELQRLVVTTEPSKYPVTLDEIKKQVEITDDDDSHDAFLSAAISAATERCESFTSRSLITRTLTLWKDSWPIGEYNDSYWEGWKEGPESIINAPARAIILPRPPLQSIVHVKTYDDSDNATTYSTSNYLVDTVSQPGRMVLRDSSGIPVSTRSALGLEVQYKAGYGDEMGSIPQDLRQGVLMMAAWLFEHRGDEEGEDAMQASGAEMMWKPYRIMRI